MRTRTITSLVLAFTGLLTWSLTRGQEKQPTPPTVAPKSASPTAAPPVAAVQPPARDGGRLNELQRQMLLNAQRGAEWLYRMNDVKGRFVYGLHPAVAEFMEGDDYLRQAAAACALARAARYLGEDRYTVRAAQAILSLLLDTAVDPKAPQLRYCALPPAAVNRLGAAGLLILAINELPNPQNDLLDQSEQLCNYIRRQARPDGSLRCHELSEEDRPDAPAAVESYPGLALAALSCSQRQRPAAWKTELVRKAVSFYHPWWKTHKSLAFVPWQTAAYAEAFLLTKDKAFANCVLEMNDWLCGLQYDQLDGRLVKWYGGFKAWADGSAVESAPTITTAVHAAALGDACRVARELADVKRYDRYSNALSSAVQFLATLQYTSANAGHFESEFRDKFLVGGFHASRQDGDLRIDYTAHAVAALVLYLEHGPK
jgi:hypothetical protein